MIAATNVPLVVADQDRALAFYRDVLGFEVRGDYQRKGWPRYLTVAPPGSEVEFVLVKGRHRTDPRPAATAKDTAGHQWVLATGDCRGEAERLRKRGLRLKAPGVVEAPFGLMAAFTDPDGNHFALLQPSK
jgi:predicted enzyme related to lactoylglutathione lyase